MNWNDIIKGSIPILVSCIAWLLSQVISLETRITKLESAMPVLISADGVPNDSPQSAAARAELKDKMTDQLNELRVRISIIENEQKK